MSHERQGGCRILQAGPAGRIFPEMDDPRQLLEEGRFEELAHDDHPLWRGLALLELKRWPQAARTFEEAPDADQSGTMMELAGAARWWFPVLDRVGRSEPFYRTFVAPEHAAEAVSVTARGADDVRLRGLLKRCLAVAGCSSIAGPV